MGSCAERGLGPAHTGDEHPAEEPLAALRPLGGCKIGGHPEPG